jgi:hypothetical protein
VFERIEQRQEIEGTGGKPGLVEQGLPRQVGCFRRLDQAEQAQEAAFAERAAAGGKLGVEARFDGRVGGLFEQRPAKHQMRGAARDAAPEQPLLPRHLPRRQTPRECR